MNSITKRLVLYFSTALLIFSIVSFVSFSTLISDYTTKVNSEQLQERAKVIAEGFTESMLDTRFGGTSAYFDVIGDIAMADVWLVDKNYNTIAFSDSETAASVPEDFKEIVISVFKQNIVVNEGYSEILNSNSVTVGYPVVWEDYVIGAVLLRSSVELPEKTINDTITTLAMSFLVGLIASIILSLIFSLKFTRPLKKMEEVSTALALGDYTAKTEIVSRDEIGKLAQTIDILSQRLEEARQESLRNERQKNEFFANISHELRTPITVLRASLEALIDGIIVDEKMINEYYIQIHKETIYLQRLIGDLLELSRLDNPKFEISKDLFSSDDLLNDLYKFTKQLVISKNIQLKFNNNSSFDLYADYERIRQMLITVISNAVKFSDENSVIEIYSKENNITIKDYGMGISDVNSIFDKFARQRSEINKEGTGLGLAIASEIAKRHDIDITVESEVGVGSTFIFSFKKTKFE